MAAQSDSESQFLTGHTWGSTSRGPRRSFGALERLTYKRHQTRLTDNTRHHAHAHSMDADEREDASGELYVVRFASKLEARIRLCQGTPI